MAEFLKLMEDWDGYSVLRRDQVPRDKLARFLEVVTNADGHLPYRHEYILKETMTTSDFPNLFGLALDHSILARYRTAPSPWRNLFQIGKCKDFNERKIHKVQGQQNLLPEVKPKAEYPQEDMSEAYYTISVKKRGRQFDISWEARINDILGAMNDIPERFAQAVLNTEASLATATYCGAAAPNASLFGAPIVDVDGESVTNLGSLPLNIENLEITLGLMAEQVDAEGIPLGIQGIHLVVPPRLQFTARKVLTSAYVQQVDTVGGANASTPVYAPLPTTNVLPDVGLKLHVDPWIPKVMAGAGAAVHKTWFVFAEKSMDGAAMEMDNLTGHESPEICMKASDKVTVGGGAIDPLEGDFGSDGIKYRVRHCLGHAQLDPRFAYAQVG